MEKYVAAGVRYLDSLREDWECLIDWNVLDIWSLRNCIIGQLSLHIDFGLDFMYSDHVHHGFEVLNTDSSAEYEALTQAWKDWHRSGCRRV